MYPRVHLTPALVLEAAQSLSVYEPPKQATHQQRGMVLDSKARWVVEGHFVVNVLKKDSLAVKLFLCHRSSTATFRCGHAADPRVRSNEVRGGAKQRSKQRGAACRQCCQERVCNGFSVPPKTTERARNPVRGSERATSMLPADVDKRVVSDVCAQLSRSQATLSNQLGSPRGQGEGNQHTKDWRSE